MEGIIFDFNGTMFFDSDKHEKAWTIFIENLIGKKPTSFELKKYMHGRNTNSTISYFLDRELTEKEKREMPEKKEKIYRDLCLKDLENFKLAPGLVELLDYLKNENYPINIATASNIVNLKFYFKHFHLDNWFDFNKVVYDDGTVPGKPDPTLFIRACQNINLDPKNCIIVEDALSGLEAAHRAKAGKIIALGKTLDKNTLKDIPYIDDVIYDYYDFKKYL